MDFSIWCPTDGTVEVGLDDIDSVVVRGGSDVEIVFVCPVCGGRISLAAQVPQALLASLGEGWVNLDDSDRRVELRREDGPPLEPADAAPEDAARIEAYCEYFRREMASADTVDAMLAEIDSAETR